MAGAGPALCYYMAPLLFESFGMHITSVMMLGQLPVLHVSHPEDAGVAQRNCSCWPGSLALRMWSWCACLLLLLAICCLRA